MIQKIRHLFAVFVISTITATIFSLLSQTPTAHAFTYGAGISGNVTTSNGTGGPTMTHDWFGQYIVNGTRTYCIDGGMGRPDETGSTLGDIPAQRGATPQQQGMLQYILWKHGQTTNNSTAAYVAGNVYGLSHDQYANPDQNTMGYNDQTVKAGALNLYNEALTKYGPWTMQVSITNGSGNQRQVTVQLRGGGGQAIDGESVQVTVTNGTGSQTYTTNASGNITFTSTISNAAQPLQVSGSIAAPGPYAVYWDGNSAHQRVITGSGTTVTASATTQVPTITTKVSDQLIPVDGGKVTDTAVLSGTNAGDTGTITVDLYGPFPTAADIKCDIEPVDSKSYQVSGPGSSTSPEFTVTQAGVYTFVETYHGDNGLTATHPCGQNEETFWAVSLATKASSQTVQIGGTVHDIALLTGVPAGMKGTIKVQLYGPFDSREAIKQDMTKLVGEKTYDVTSIDARTHEYPSPEFTVTQAGYYTFYETWTSEDGTVTVSETFGAEAETFVVPPKAPATGLLKTGLTGIAALTTVAGGLGFTLFRKFGSLLGK